MDLSAMWIHGNARVGGLRGWKDVDAVTRNKSWRRRRPVVPSAMKSRENDGRNIALMVAGKVFDGIEDGISAIEKKSATVDPEVQLQGNFYPVPESPLRHDLQVVGQIPSSLDGCVYVRNGGNVRFEPRAGYHIFDGDGMLHAVMFTHDRASYCSRFTRTNRFITEEKHGGPCYPKPIGELHGKFGILRVLLYSARGVLGLVDPREGMGVANAGVVFFNGRLLAMSEDDKPYFVRVTPDGDLETVGRFDFHGQLRSSMIAHPKLDPRTGELFALSYDVLRKPYLKYFVFRPDGIKGPDVTISLEKPTMVHDFAITENYAVIPDHQVVFDLTHMMLAGGSPLVFDANKVSRFGVLPKGDANEERIVWIELPAGCFCFHLWNAWEENSGDEIVVVGSGMSPPDYMFNASYSEKKITTTLMEIRLNMKTKSASRTEIAPHLTLEAGSLNRAYIGCKCKYVYMAIVEPWPKVSGIVKIDLETHQVIGEIRYGEGRYGGEPCFVPASTPAAEDDGYLLTFVFDEKSGKSELVILDASSPSLQTVAAIKLPTRVPFGFHGTFLTSDDLAAQL